MLYLCNGLHITEQYSIKLKMSNGVLQRNCTDSTKLSYENRLSRLGLESLLHRRVKTDLVMFYKILHNHVNIDCVNFFQCSALSCTRGNVIKLNKPRILSTRDSHFFRPTNRTINVWNSLLDSTVTAPTVNCFKRKLDKFLLWVHCF